jgi:hypothetical protein
MRLSYVHVPGLSSTIVAPAADARERRFLAPVCMVDRQVKPPIAKPKSTMYRECGRDGDFRSSRIAGSGLNRRGGEWYADPIVSQERNSLARIADERLYPGH